MSGGERLWSAPNRGAAHLELASGAASVLRSVGAVEANIDLEPNGQTAAAIRRFLAAIRGALEHAQVPT